MSALRSISALTLSLALALGACGKTEAPAAKEGGAAKGPSPIAAVMFGSGSSDQGEALFGRECAFCHVGKSTGALMLGRRLGNREHFAHQHRGRHAPVRRHSHRAARPGGGH